MPSSTSNSEPEFERPIPAQPWKGIVLTVVLLTVAATGIWEIYCRHLGYGPSLNDTADLWSETRRAVQPDSIVIIGDSRAHFDLDLDALEQGLGQRPVQLAFDGSCAYPVLEDLANDQRFHGTVICSIVPGLWLVPQGGPVANSQRLLKRYRTGTLSQWSGHKLGMLLEERLAFMKSEELDLQGLLKEIDLPNRPGALLPPRFPPYFGRVTRDRRERMIPKMETSAEFQHEVQQIWMHLFVPPPPPTFVPKDVFFAGVGKAIEARFKDTAAAVEKLRARGGKVVFVRFPISGELLKLENQATPKAGPWTRILNETHAPGIYWSDYPELASFQCPEWSHLSNGDSIEFTKRLVPHLRQALK